MISGQLIVDAARQHLGTPFHHQGRAPRKGIDCIGLLILIAKDLGYQAHDAVGYSLRPQGKRLENRLAKSCDRVEHLTDAQEGDILCFHFLGKGYPQHVGILTSKGMIHTYRDVGKVVEHTLDDSWMDRLHSIWRFRETT